MFGRSTYEFHGACCLRSDSWRAFSGFRVRESLISRAGCVYLPIPGIWVFMGEIVVDLGRLGQDGSVSFFLPFRFPCMEGEVDFMLF